MNVDASDDPYSSKKVSLRTGNFMGATYNEDGSVKTKQEIQPEILNKLDNANNVTMGQSILHEVTESYKAGQIVKEEKLSVGSAIPSDAKNPNSVYYRAHNGVTPAGGNLYIQPVQNSNGKLTEINFYTGKNNSTLFFNYILN